MREGLHIRTLTVADLPVVMHHRCAMFAEMKYGDAASVDAMAATSEPFFRRKIEEEKYHGWLIENAEGRVISGGGIVILEYQSQPLDPRSSRAYVVNMFTEPEYRQQGLARELMDVMISWCREQKMKLLFLHASKDGRPLYESLGFKQTNEMRLEL